MRLFRLSLFFTFIAGLNTSEEDPDPSRIPHTVSDSDITSPSQDVTPGRTRLADVFGVGITHALGTAIPGQGGKFSGSGDKSRLHAVPQESQHNGQERAGSVISALAHMVADSELSFTETERDSSLSSAGTQWPGRSTRTPPTSARWYSNTNTISDHATSTNKIPRNTHYDADPNARSQSGDVTVASSEPSHSTTLDHRAPVSGRHVTNGRDASVMSSDDDVVHRSIGTSGTDRVPPPNRSNKNNPYASVTEDGNVPTSSGSTIRTNRFPQSTRTTEHILNRTPTSLFENASAATSPRSRRIDASTLFRSDVSDYVTTATQKRAESPSYTPIFYAGVETSHATFTVYTTAPEQTSNRHVSDADASSRPPDLHTTSVPSARRDFATYSPNTLGQGDHLISTTLHTSYVPSTTSGNDPTTTRAVLIASPAETGRRTQTDHQMASTSVSYATTRSTESSPTTFARSNPSTSRSETPSRHLASPSTKTHLLRTTTRIPTRLATSVNELPTPQAYTTARSRPGAHTPPSPAITPTSSRRAPATKPGKDRKHGGRVFIREDQPAIINAETFQVLLQVILEKNSSSYTALVEVEPFLHTVAGFHSQHVTWHSGPVLQSVVTFRTEKAVSWLGRAESLLQEAGLRPLPTRGVFVSGVRVKNITVGGLHTDVCSWLFSCPSDFYCVSSEGNVTCRSVCHSEYCKNHGICVHHAEHRPLCQCPVGEDFWYMGQRCDLRMTRQRLAGVCVGVLSAIAALMALLAFLAVQRFKKMLIQAKAEQTQSSYRRFNHFDELSARFWRRSWPGSEDSLDNTAFSRSDEFLHMRALDRTCCYHDDTLSIASTYPDSVTRLNTVYPHGSQYHWDMSMCSLADGVIDSGKASDLSVCSWPIEPIQWTPFPLLQQLKNSNTMKPSRPRSYCEGMELVGLEKSRTA